MYTRTTNTRTTWLQASCALTFSATVDTPLVLMLRPRSGPQQWVASEQYHLTPAVPVVEYTDGFGNLCQRLVAPTGRFEVRTAARVMVAPAAPADPAAPFIPIPTLPHAVLGYLLPSRYCEVDRLGEMAHEIVGAANPGYPQVATITEWVRDTVSYVPGSSSYPVSALEDIDRGEGLEPMDVHAWLDAYLGQQWYVFDPSSRLSGPRIAIAHGRDATDVAIYNQFGPPLLPDEMQVAVEPLEYPA